MAVTFELTSTGLATIDFTSGTDFDLQDDFYLPVTATPTGDGSIPPYVTETVPVLLRGTSHDDLAVSMQELAALQKRAAEYWVDQQQAIPVWLNCKLHAETSERRALVKAIHCEFRPDIEGLYRDCVEVQDYLVGTVLIERHPYWERPTARMFLNTTPAAAAAVAYDYTALGPNLLLNPSFTDAGLGGADIWDIWIETEGDGVLANEIVNFHTAPNAVAARAGPTAVTRVHQDITVVANQDYYLFFYTRGDGAEAGRYAIYDNSNGAWIVPYTSTGVPGVVYDAVRQDFTTPAGCTSVRIEFLCPVTDGVQAYFDTADVRFTDHDIVGDVPARVNALTIKSATGGATLDRYWIGIRGPDKHGATGVTNFIPVWECEDGTNIGDTSVSDDGGGSEPNTASPGGGSGDYVIVNPGAGGTAINWSDGSFHVVFSLGLGNVGYGAGEYPDAAGRFVCLLRTRMQTAGNEWRVRVRSGSVSNVQNYHDPVKIASTSWNYYQSALINIPMRNKQALESTLLAANTDYDALHIEAMQITGSGDLYLDCLCLVPADEGYVYIIDASTQTTRCVFVGEGPKGDTQALQIDGTTVYSNEAFEFEHFRLPPGDGRIICVYGRSANSVFTDQVEFADVAQGTSAYTERWAGLRGAE